MTDTVAEFLRGCVLEKPEATLQSRTRSPNSRSRRERVSLTAWCGPNAASLPALGRTALEPAVHARRARAEVRDEKCAAEHRQVFQEHALLIEASMGSFTVQKLCIMRVTGTRKATRNHAPHLAL